LQVKAKLVTSAGNGQMLYMKATCNVTEGDDEDAKTSNKTALYVFQTRSFPTLDKYRKQHHEDVPFIVHSTIENRIEALMKERISQQGLRQSRMQGRWYQLKDELFLIQQIRDTSRKRAQIRSAFSAQVH